MSDMSTDTTTPATDKELVQIEGKARANTVMHWPELVRMINRLRQAEAERDRLREALEETVKALEWLADPARHDITVTSYAQATLGLIDRDQPGHAALAKEAGQ
jgi:hypothetical protein